MPSPALVTIAKELLHNSSLVKALERILAWQAAVQVCTSQMDSVQGDISMAQAPAGAWCGWTSAGEKNLDPDWPKIAVFNGEETLFSSLCFPLADALKSLIILVSWNDTSFFSSQIPIEIHVYSEIHIWALMRDYFAHWRNSCLHDQNYYAELLVSLRVDQ